MQVGCDSSKERSREMKRWKLIAVAVMMVVLINSNVMAEGEGRYQAVAIQKVKDSDNPKVFIIDTKEGHLWLWSSSAVSYQPRRDGSIPIHEFLTYQGQLKPGKKIGDVVDTPPKK
jgi:hypothetical protein